MWTGQGLNLPLEKLSHFFLGPWLLVCQFIDISNQIEPTGEVANILQKNLYNVALYKKILSMLVTSPFDSIWLEISTNWHTSSQGPKKNSIKITKRRIDPCPAHTARNKGSFTTMVLWTTQRFLSSTVQVMSFRCQHYYVFLRDKCTLFSTALLWNKSNEPSPYIKS